MSTHVTVVCEVWNWTWMVASTGTISDWSRANDDAAAASTAKVISRRPRSRLQE